MSQMFVGYVDEAGDEGFKFDKGSTEWFVVSCVVTPEADEPRFVSVIQETTELVYDRAVYPLHFHALNHDQRLPYVDLISKTNAKIFSVLIHKPSLGLSAKQFRRHGLYFSALYRVFQLVIVYLQQQNIGDIFGLFCPIAAT